jgi:hypothetical protein
MVMTTKAVGTRSLTGPTSARHIVRATTDLERIVLATTDLELIVLELIKRLATVPVIMAQATMVFLISAQLVPVRWDLGKATCGPESDLILADGPISRVHPMLGDQYPTADLWLRAFCPQAGDVRQPANAVSTAVLAASISTPCSAKKQRSQQFKESIRAGSRVGHG